MNREKREIKPAGNNPPPNNSNTSAGLPTPLPRNEDSHPLDLCPKELARTTISPSSVATKATGPRTPQGKDKSKRNATKHGILSGSLILPRESRAEYESLLNGLQASLEPKGMLEEILVEKLATNLWRHRRLIAAESAEIRGSVRFANWSPSEGAEAVRVKVRVFGLPNWRGLIHDIENTDHLNRCLELLSELRQGTETKGFTEEDSKILERVYGRRNGNESDNNLYAVYLKWARTGKVHDGGQLSKAASPEQSKQHILRCIDEEIQRLTRNHKARMATEAERKMLEELRRHVPGNFSSDRLLRYEAHFERIFDRTLSQLERLQRMRLGQPCYLRSRSSYPAKNCRPFHSGEEPKLQNELADLLRNKTLSRFRNTVNDGGAASLGARKVNAST